MYSLRQIFSPLCLLVSLILLTYTIYRSQIYYDGEKNDYYSVYFILSGLLFLFSVISFFIRDNIKDYIIISLLSILFSFYLFETYMITVKPIKYFFQTGKIYDIRSPLQIFNDLRKNNQNIQSVITPSGLLNKEKIDFFPLSGISNSKTINCNENGYFSIYLSDRYGFNNPDFEWDKKEIEYLLVGDSFTHNACVNRPNDIGSVLRNLSRKSVLNLGYGGNGPLLEYATLKEYLNSNVKKVLWVYTEGNDLLDLEIENNNYFLKNYLNNENFFQNLKMRQKEVDNLSIERSNLQREKGEREINTFKFKFFKFIKLYNVRSIIFPNKYDQPKMQPEFKEILQLAKNLTLENNQKLFFIYLPSYNRYKTNYHDNNYQEIKTIIKDQLNITFIDIVKIFEKEKDPLKFFPFKFGGHYNVEGYKIVAENIFDLTK